jgi:hypothetical protein
MKHTPPVMTPKLNGSYHNGNAFLATCQMLIIAEIILIVIIDYKGAI